jgi:nucleotide-binding universal stress UspA family protein
MVWSHKHLVRDVHHVIPSACYAKLAEFREVMPTGRVTAINTPTNPVVPLQRILVATDFSAGARAALDYALGIARHFHSQVYLVHVIPAEVLLYVSPEGSEEAIQQARKFAAREMRRLVEEAGCTGMVHEEILCGGGIWPLLQGFVRAQAIDLMVLGTHGRTAAKKQLLGAVAEEIFRLAECPVLTVGARSEKPALATHGVHRILYATNFKPHSERAATFAHSMEREHGAKMTVLHVVEDQSESPTNSQGIIRDFMIRRMRKGLPPACVGNCEPEFEVRFGDPGKQILSVAREQNSDLIILGLRAGTHTEGQLPSAIAYKLVCQAACPVLTTRL